jgi:hypothetical protein
MLIKTKTSGWRILQRKFIHFMTGPNDKAIFKPSKWNCAVGSLIFRLEYRGNSFMSSGCLPTNKAWAKTLT